MRPVLVLLTLCLLAACAPQAPKSRYEADLAACRRNAEQTLGPVSIDPSQEHNPAPMALADREKLRGQYDSLVDHCMTELPPFTDAPKQESGPKGLLNNK